MKLRKSEGFALIITLLFAVLLVGYSAGKNEVSGKYKIETAATNKTLTAVSKETPLPEDISQSSEPAKNPGDLININTATLQELQKLSGIGEVMAQRIIDYRDISGGFDNISEIKEVSGIGDAIFAKLENQITVG